MRVQRSIASWTRFSPNIFWSAARTGAIWSQGCVLDTATNVTEPAVRPAGLRRRRCGIGWKRVRRTWGGHLGEDRLRSWRPCLGRPRPSAKDGARNRPAVPAFLHRSGPRRRSRSRGRAPAARRRRGVSRVRSTDAKDRGLRLRAIADARGLILLVGADVELAEAIGADGVHLPERLRDAAPGLRADRPNGLITLAAHDEGAVAPEARPISTPWWSRRSSPATARRPERRWAWRVCGP
jgi:hypothetical protein